jgi:transposase
MSKQDTQGKSTRTRRRHAAAFKRELVERSLQPGASVSGIALENGINANVLFRWRREQLRAAASARHERLVVARQFLEVPVDAAPGIASTAAANDELQSPRATFTCRHCGRPMDALMNRFRGR